MVGIVFTGTNPIAEDAHGTELAAVDAREGEDGVARDLEHVRGDREVAGLAPQMVLDLAEIVLEAGRQHAAEQLGGKLLAILDARPLVALLELQRSLPKNRMSASAQMKNLNWEKR